MSHPYVIIEIETGVYVNRVVADSPSDIALKEGQQVVDDDPSLYTMPSVAPMESATPMPLPEDPVEAQRILLELAKQPLTL